MIKDLLHGPDAVYFMRRAQAVLAGLPQPFRAPLAQVVLEVEEFATAEQLASVGLDDPWDLSGLYEGRPLPDQSIWASGDLPPRISLFRQPMLLEQQETGVDLDDLIRHVTIHEAGHHFGFSDDDMHLLEEEG
ncbi:metallopeptidase family protein [Erythrobacteraceae bacterium CFH 75059]|uniref:metallopeptidase family protein n=1 Tax=Qipengyuania thermophila TaxID=2509361 RepID=UPI00102251BA|nr:metallopeptidase family protein [Qipengyuania thermophila]TCD05048.1 metallopeptidase family protein [Erythrobacteraceae bacterium CFH 75059]